MIMQNPGGDEDFYSDFLSPSSNSALNEADAPVADWRFLPHRMGPRVLRIDGGHAAVPQRVRLPGRRDQTIASATTSFETLYFG